MTDPDPELAQAINDGLDKLYVKQKPSEWIMKRVEDPRGIGYPPPTTKDVVNAILDYLDQSQP